MKNNKDRLSKILSGQDSYYNMMIERIAEIEFKHRSIIEYSITNTGEIVNKAYRYDPPGTEAEYRLLKISLEKYISSEMASIQC